MSKPDDIPQDVWDIATKAAFGHVPDGMERYIRPHRLERIANTARAILAEREAAAMVVEGAAAPYMAASVDTLSVASKLRLVQAHTFLMGLAVTIRTGQA